MKIGELISVLRVIAKLDNFVFEGRKVSEILNEAAEALENTTAYWKLDSEDIRRPGDNCFSHVWHCSNCGETQVIKQGFYPPDTCPCCRIRMRNAPCSK